MCGSSMQRLFTWHSASSSEVCVVHLRVQTRWRSFEGLSSPLSHPCFFTWWIIHPYNSFSLDVQLRKWGMWWIPRSSNKVTLFWGQILSYKSPTILHMMNGSSMQKIFTWFFASSSEACYTRFKVRISWPSFEGGSSPPRCLCFEQSLSFLVLDDFKGI